MKKIMFVLFGLTMTLLFAITAAAVSAEDVNANPDNWDSILYVSYDYLCGDEPIYPGNDTSLLGSVNISKSGIDFKGWVATTKKIAGFSSYMESASHDRPFIEACAPSQEALDKAQSIGAADVAAFSINEDGYPYEDSGRCLYTLCVEYADGTFEPFWVCESIWIGEEDGDSCEEGYLIKTVGVDKYNGVVFLDTDEDNIYDGQKIAPGTTVYAFCFADGLEAVGIKVNGVASNEVDNFMFSFVMPESDVELEFLLAPTYRISLIGAEADNAEIYSYIGPGILTDHAVEGAEVPIYYSGEKILKGVKVNGQVFTAAQNNGICYFTMPAEDVQVELILEDKVTGKITFTGTDSEYATALVYDETKNEYITVTSAEVGTEIIVRYQGADFGKLHTLKEIVVNGETIKSEYHTEIIDGKIVKFGYESKFIMPNSDVDVEVLLDLRYSIDIVSDLPKNTKLYVYTEYPYVRTDSFAPGDEVIVYYNSWSGYILKSVLVNGTPITEKNEDGFYYFTMPAEDVELVAIIPSNDVTFADTSVLEYADIYVKDKESENGWIYNSVNIQPGEQVAVFYDRYGYKLNGIKINGVLSTDCSSGGYYYFFYMPDEDVVVELLEERIPTITVVGDLKDEFFVGVPSDDGEGYFQINFAEKGTKFIVDFWHQAYVCTGIIVNGNLITKANDDASFWVTMPDEDVIIKPIIEKKYAIKINDDMADSWIEDGNTRYGVDYALPGEEILIARRLGDMIMYGIVVNGERLEDYGSNHDSSIVRFTMPEEDVVIDVLLRERKTYKIKIADSSHLHVNDIVAAAEGDCISFFPKEIIGYDAILTINGVAVDCDDNYFVMPNYDVELDIAYRESINITSGVIELDNLPKIKRGDTVTDIKIGVREDAPYSFFGATFITYEGNFEDIDVKKILFSTDLPVIATGDTIPQSGNIALLVIIQADPNFALDKNEYIMVNNKLANAHVYSELENGEPMYFLLFNYKDSEKTDGGLDVEMVVTELTSPMSGCASVMSCGPVFIALLGISAVFCKKRRQK